MSDKSLIFHFVAHKPYFKTANEKNASKMQNLFYAISQVYIPLLNMFANLEEDEIPFKMGLTISPTLCAQLSNPEIQQEYINWLDKLIELGDAEVSRAENAEKKRIAKFYVNRIKRDKRDYIETFNKDLLSKFSYYTKKGNLELFATSATYAFLPHIADFEEAVNAQIEVGLMSHKNFFGVAPEGFMLPHLGYTKGLEKNLRSYGLNYTILDSHGLLFANPTPSMGLFEPIRNDISFAFFGRDARIDEEVKGYMQNEVYRNQQRDIGFDSDLNDLSEFLGSSEERCQTLFKYYANNDELYDGEKAKNQIYEDAKKFVDSKIELLQQAEYTSEGKDCNLLCFFDNETLGEKWYEGIDWLEQVFRLIAENGKISTKNCFEITKTQYQLGKAQPAFSAIETSGTYGEDFLDSSNDWMIRYLRKSTARMIDLAERFSENTGLKARALNLATKEILLSQSSDWPKMLHDKNDPDFAKEQFVKTINGFSAVFESLGSNVISTEWMTNLEREHDLFPWINYMIYRKKQ